MRPPRRLGRARGGPLGSEHDPHPIVRSALLVAETAVLARWSVRCAGSDQLPAVAAEVVHAVMAGLRAGDRTPVELAESSYAFGVLRAQEGRDVAALVEDLLALRHLVWGQVASEPGVRGDLAELLLLQDRLTELTDRALRCAVDAFVEESTRVLASMVTRDALTGLLNRAGLHELLTSSETAGGNRLPGLLVIDLDGFKSVNDLQGHLAGDEILKRVAVVLTATVGSEGAAARLGGDEFAVALPGADEARCAAVARRVLAAARLDRGLVGGPTPVRLSVGVACLAPPAGVTDLLAAADAAMYEAKRAGGDRFTVLHAEARRAAR